MNIRHLLFCIFSLFITSCSFNLDVNKPVDLLWNKLGDKTDRLIIFLPGIFDTAETFQEEQFFTLARKAGIKADMVAASIHMGHLLQEMMVERIEKDVFQYLKNAGYKNIWFVGISLGGLNSLLFYQKHTKEICGVVTLEPYLGNTSLTKELQLAGGIIQWQPKTSENKSKNILEQRIQFLWQWLQQQDLKNNLQSVFLGYGDQDRYVESIKLLHSILEKKNVTLVEGKHNWETGRKIWQQQLLSRRKTGLLQSCN